MKSLGILVCTTLLAGCTSATMQQSDFPARQAFGYPHLQSLPLPLPPLPPAPAAAAPAGPAASAAATAAPTVPLAAPPAAVVPAREPAQEASVGAEPLGAPYDEKKDPIMRNLLAQATMPPEDAGRMVDGRVVLPPRAKLDIIDIRDVSETLRAASVPAS